MWVGQLKYKTDVKTHSPFAAFRCRSPASDVRKLSKTTEMYRKSCIFKIIYKAGNVYIDVILVRIRVTIFVVLEQ